MSFCPRKGPNLLPPTTVEAFAPAKVNLTLHVTGRRADGYHLLDSLVVFAGVGDRLSVSLDRKASFDVTGPFARAVPSGPDNLVNRAARLMDLAGELRITLEKNLPAEAGLGGGSADAAAALRALVELTGQALPEAAQILTLGADVPVCMDTRPARMEGIGEGVTRLTDLPPIWLVLANPGVAVPTPKVFASLEKRDNPPMEMPTRWVSCGDLVDWLGQQRNDLETPACIVAPAVTVCLGALGTLPGCLLARMSGSGATCFGVFMDEAAANAAATRLQGSQPDWWVAAAPVLGAASACAGHHEVGEIGQHITQVRGR